MNNPINAETFLPALLVEWLTEVRSDLGLPADLSIFAAPYMGDFALPALVVGCPGFKFTGHPATADYEIHITLHTDSMGDPVLDETPAAALTRRAAICTQENATLGLLRAALSLRLGQTLPTTVPVDSFFDWIGDRTPPGTEDGWALEDLLITAGIGIEYDEKNKLRRRGMTLTARMMTNEFTV